MSAGLRRTRAVNTKVGEGERWGLKPPREQTSRSTDARPNDAVTLP